MAQCFEIISVIESLQPETVKKMYSPAPPLPYVIFILVGFALTEQEINTLDKAK